MPKKQTIKQIEHSYFELDNIFKKAAEISGLNNCPTDVTLTTNESGLLCDAEHRKTCSNVAVDNYYCKCPTDVPLVIDKTALSCDENSIISCSNSGVNNYYCK